MELIIRFVFLKRYLHRLEGSKSAGRGEVLVCNSGSGRECQRPVELSERRAQGKLDR